MARKSNKASFWMSLSDIMTALMVIFMFISISYMIEANKQKAEVAKVVSVYDGVKKEMGDELANLVQNDLKKWNKNIDFDRVTLSVKFVGKDIQFHPDSDRIRTRFLQILKDFVPKYLAIVSQPKYRDKIAEIRIEGHANKPRSLHGRKSYLEGIAWSQRRAKKVLDFTVSSKEFKSFDTETRNRMEFWLVANGYGFGRTLDGNNQYTIDSNEKICSDCSRRVEFRIITTSEQVITEILEKIK